MAVGTLAAIGLGLGAVSTGVQVAGGIAQADAQRDQAAFEAEQHRFNAQIAEVQSADALRRGEQEAQDFQTQVKGIKGAQKVAIAGQGVDISSGSAAQIQEDTDRQARLDLITIKNNAAREAFGYKAQAVMSRGSAQMTMMAGEKARASTLLTTGANVVGGIASGIGRYEDAKYRASKAG